MLFEERLDKEIWINGSTKYENEILEICLSIYHDYIKGEYQLSNRRPNGERSSKTGRGYYDYGMFNKRKRSDVIFRVEDVDAFVDRFMNRWLSYEENKDKKLSRSMEDILSGEGYYAMYIRDLKSYDYSVTPVRIESYSLKYPYKMYRERTAFKEMTRKEFMTIIESGDLLPFNEEGIQLLKKRTREVISKEL